MAVVVKTLRPRGLLFAIRKAIDAGTVLTWSYDDDGDFTHSVKQWARRAWLRPRIVEGGLVFNIIPPRGRNISRVVYGIYHGRLIEMLLNHFDARFTEVSASAKPVKPDRVRGRVAGV
jgi:hypothetical protein